MLLQIKALITFRSFPSKMSGYFFTIRLFHSHSHRVQIGRQRGHNTNIISLLHKSALSLTVAHTRAPILTRTHTCEWAHTHEHTHTYETLFNNAEIGPLSTDYRMQTVCKSKHLSARLKTVDKKLVWARTCFGTLGFEMRSSSLLQKPESIESRVSCWSLWAQAGAKAERYKALLTTLILRYVLLDLDKLLRNDLIKKYVLNVSISASILEVRRIVVQFLS